MTVPNTRDEWFALFVKPASPVTDEQAWAKEIDDAMWRGDVGFAVQTSVPFDTSYLRYPDGTFELRATSRTARDELVRALASFTPPAELIREERHP